MRIIASILLAAVLMFGFTDNVYAVGCGVSVASEVLVSSSVNFDFSVSNVGENSIVWVKIPTDFGSDLSITGASSEGWEVSNESGSYIFTNGSLAPGGDPHTFSVSGDTGPNETTINWILQASEQGAEGEVFNCDTVSISLVNGLTVTPPPGVSNIAASVSSTTATITWRLDSQATGIVYYGTTTGYGSSVATVGGSSESVSLTGLTPSTIYHYQIQVTGVGGTTTVSDNTFTTAAAGVATTVTTTVTTATTTTTTFAATATRSDTSSPSVSITTKLSEPFTQPPEIMGKASDSSRVVKIDYSTDGGANWLPVDQTDNLGSKIVNFSFIPNVFDDGNYTLMVRAIDGAENTGRSKSFTLVIDRLPPLVGGNTWSIGPIPLLPGSDGVITTLSGVNNKITMSAVGGPTSIDLIVGEVVYPMVKSISSGLWSGVVNFSLPGHYVIKVRSIDGANNIVERNLDSIQVIGSGHVTSKDVGVSVLGASVKVYQQDELSKVWSLWDGASFGQNGTQTVNENGGYSLFLPSGTYYLNITASGYRKLTSKIFKLNSPTALNTNFEMQKGWWINPFEAMGISVNKAKFDTNEVNISSLVKTEAPGFLLPTVSGNDLDLISLRGKNRMLVFLNTWLPATSEQISVISSLEEIYKDRISIIMVEENISKVSVFAKKGGYENLSIATDSDGTLIDFYKLNSMPVGYFIDKRGVIQKVVTGVITADEIKNTLDSI